MKITICGSMDFAELMDRVKLELEGRGHEVLLPQLLMKSEDGKPMSIRQYWETYAGKEFQPGHTLWEKKAEAISDHFGKVENSDAVLILNETKKGISNYIGGNTLLEMGLAFYLKKPIYLFNPVPDVFYREEILGMKPIVINRDLAGIAKHELGARKPERPRLGVGVMLVKNGKVLLGRRHKDPKKAGSELHGEGTWTLPGGKVEFQENLDEAVIRETLEETGIRLAAKDLKFVSVGDDMVPDAHYVSVGFIAKKFKGEPKVMEPDKITEWKWFGLKTLPRPMYKPSKKVIENYLKKVLYK